MTVFMQEELQLALLRSPTGENLFLDRVKHLLHLYGAPYNFSHKVDRLISSWIMAM